MPQSGSQIMNYRPFPYALCDLEGRSPQDLLQRSRDVEAQLLICAQLLAEVKSIGMVQAKNSIHTSPAQAYHTSEAFFLLSKASSIMDLP